MGYNPHIPDSKSPQQNWAKETHNKAQYERRMLFSSKVLGTQTSRGFVPRASQADGDFEFPDGIEWREYDVCVQLDDGTSRAGFVILPGSVYYFKDAQGNPVDENGNAITNLPPTTGEA